MSARKQQPKTLGARIRAIREAANRSQAELSKAIEISQPYLSQIEADIREPTLTVAARLARELGVTLDELAGDL